MVYAIVATIAQVVIALVTLAVCVGADLLKKNKEATTDTTEAPKTW